MLKLHLSMNLFSMIHSKSKTNAKNFTSIRKCNYAAARMYYSRKSITIVNSVRVKEINKLHGDNL